MLLRESKTSHYRAKAYRPDDSIDYRYLDDEGDIRELDAWIDDEVGSGRSCGAIVEMYVPHFGWVVYND